MAERPPEPYKEFEMVQSQVLDMAHARSTDMFGKLKSGSARRWSVQDEIRESDKYAPSSP
jgi:hypothetical protein